MSKVIINKIDKNQIVEKLQKNFNNNGRLVAINGYINKNGENVVVYTIEHDEVRELFSIEGEDQIPTATEVYKGAAWFEEEIQEVMPLKFLGLKSSNRLFLPEEFKNGEGKILVLPLDELKKLKDK